MSMYAAVAKSEAEYRRARIAADFDRQRTRRRTPRRLRSGWERSGRAGEVEQPPPAHRRRWILAR
jgi:hypothetical protein